MAISTYDRSVFPIAQECPDLEEGKQPACPIAQIVAHLSSRLHQFPRSRDLSDSRSFRGLDLMPTVLPCVSTLGDLSNFPAPPRLVLRPCRALVACAFPRVQPVLLGDDLVELADLIRM